MVGSVAYLDLDGRSHSTAAWIGQPTLVNFWASWCAPCVVELPDLARLSSENEERFRVVGISVDSRDPEWVRQFVTRLGVKYPVAMSTVEIETAFPRVGVLPTSFLVDRSGRIVATYVGQVSIDQILSDVETVERGGLLLATDDGPVSTR